MSTTLFAQPILYVDDSATGANNGTTWCNGYVYLQDALAAARASGGAITEIRVAQGSYKPDQGAGQVSGDRTASFELVNAVALRGGYAGCGAPDPSVRDIGFYETVLTGDLNSDDVSNENNCCLAHRQASCDDQACAQEVCAVSPNCCSVSWNSTCAFYARNLCNPICSSLSENSYHVLRATGLSILSELDGFMVSFGNANGSPLSGNDVGAGCYATQTQLSVTNCSFIFNLAQVEGGGLYLSGGNTTVANSTIARNTAATGGGISAHGPLLLSTVSFTDNAASEAGGAVGVKDVNTGSARFQNCLFASNYSESRGGAIELRSTTESRVTCSIFVRNFARESSGGAILHWGGGAIYVARSVFVANGAGDGGGVFCLQGNMEAVDSLFLGNLSSGYGAGINILNGNLSVTQCTFAGNFAQSGSGIYSSMRVPEIRNSILWLNGSSTAGSGEHAQVDGGIVDISHSCVSGWTGALGGVGNHGNNPLLIGGPVGAWTVDATNDGNSGETTFVDSMASWQPDEWMGKFLNPDTSQYLQSLIVGNTSMTITVLGDFASLGLAGATYKINDYHLSAGSPCIDAGDNSSVPADIFDLDNDGNTTESIPFDLDGNRRFRDDPTMQDTGAGTPPIVDMGAYEYQRGCLTNAHCDDADTCNGMETCINNLCEPGTPIVCDDGVFCNGAETCDAILGCQTGTPPTCDDGVACTIDSCDSFGDACSNIPSDSLCDDSLYCNGTEICDALIGCRPGSPINCEDGITCTIDTCDEAGDRCQNMANDALCDDAEPCNGAEICDSQAGCVNAPIIDCNNNGVPDACDISSETSRDCNVDGIPDECAPVIAPSVEPSGVAKCRALSLLPGNPGGRTGLRVTMVSLHHVDPPYTGGASVPFTAFEGQLRWVGPPRLYVESSGNPIPFFAAQLQCEPYYRDWGTMGLLHVIGSEIVPSSTYEVQAVLEECSVSDEANYSNPLRMVTTRWGDVETPFSTGGPGQPDFGDISALVNKFKSQPGAPIKARAVLAGGVPDFGVDLGFDHIAACVDAYKGKPYPNLPLACP